MSIVFEPRWTPEDYRQKPREYDPELADLILLRLENGEMLPTVCRDRDMPLPATFLRWVELDPELEGRFVAARRRAAEITLDLMVCVAESGDLRRVATLTGALETWTKKTDPARFGDRATIRTKEGDEDGGIDYREEVKRRVDAIANKLAAAGRTDEAPKP